MQVHQIFIISSCSLFWLCVCVNILCIFMNTPSFSTTHWYRPNNQELSYFVDLFFPTNKYNPCLHAFSQRYACCHGNMKTYTGRTFPLVPMSLSNKIQTVTRIVHPCTVWILSLMWRASLIYLSYTEWPTITKRSFGENQRRNAINTLDSIWSWG